MSDADKLLVRRLFLQIAELPAADRGPALDRACHGNARLRTEVEALLRADAEAGQFMAAPTMDLVARKAPDGSSSSEQAGSSIGRYKLLEQIGEGGMGTIWMAEQREPVKRRVALKIIKLGMDTKQVIARFEAERQALAMMDHPNIAKVFDAGTTGVGRPYFVMEYIKGIPILEYCDKEKVDTKSRLELFTKVCHAIQHAHQKGIIHRDIKPSNVLVTLHDGVPVPKVIDFGIAKATNSELTTKTLFTEHRQMVGTPAYMSPEQAEMSGLDIDTRSDIYSLGVLLYELLTGTTPFDIKALLASGFGEMMRAIREDEPHKPSTRISSLGDTGTQTALQRRVDQKQLSSLLRGDIDWIIMKCLEKDRSRRYETANGLAADILRHLQDEPVTAGAPGAAYRLRKFVRRNRAQVFAVGAVVAALLLGVVGFAWQAAVAGEQRDRANAGWNAEATQRRQAEFARTEADQQAAIAEAVAKFQTDMLAAVDPDLLPLDPVTAAPLKDALTVVQVMRAAQQALDEGSLAGQLLVEERVRTTIGQTLRKLGRFADAEPNLVRSLAILRAARPPGHNDVVEALAELGLLRLEQGAPAEAETLFREALASRSAAFPAGSLETAGCQQNLADALQRQGKSAEAEALQREALTVLRASSAASPALASGLGSFAEILAAQGKWTEAEGHLREALAILRNAFPDGHPKVAWGLNNLATHLRSQGGLAEAERLFDEALQITRATLPAGHPKIGAGLNNVAAVLQSQGRFAEAEPLFRESLAIRRATLPAGHPEIANGLDNLGNVLTGLGRAGEAEPLHREALGILRAAYPNGHPETATALLNLGAALKDSDQLAECERTTREAVQVLRGCLPAGHPELASAMNLLGQVCWQQDKLDQSIPLFEEALPMMEKALGRQHPDTAVLVFNLGVNYADAGRLEEAIPLLEEAHRSYPDAEAITNRLMGAYQQLLKPDQPHTITRLAKFMVQLFSKALASLPKDSKERAAALTRFCEDPEHGLMRFQAWVEAEPLLRESLAIREKLAPDDWQTFHARSLLGAALLGQRKLAEAEPLLLAGFRGMQERRSGIAAKSLRRIAQALERLVQLYEAKGDAVEVAAWRNKLAAEPTQPR